MEIQEFLNSIDIKNTELVTLFTVSPSDCGYEELVKHMEPKEIDYTNLLHE